MTNKFSHSIVRYDFNGKSFEGQLFNREGSNRLPDVFIVHTWLGIDPSIQKRAERVAELGYAAFIVDLF